MERFSRIPKTIATTFSVMINFLFATAVLTTIKLPRKISNQLPHIVQPFQKINVLTTLVFAVALRFAFGMNSFFYVLILLPVITIEWIWTSFAIVAAHIQSQHVAAKIPILIGLAFSMVVSILFYTLFFYPVIGLERVWTALFDEPIEPNTSPEPQYFEYKPTPRDEQCGRGTTTDDIPFLDLGSSIEEDGEVLEGNTVQEILAQVN
jgi:hypothetical protein